MRFGAAIALLAGLAGAPLAAAQSPVGAVSLDATHDGTFHVGVEDSLEVVVDRLAPEIEIISPANEAVVGSNHVTVTGVVNDYVDPALQVPGASPVFGEILYEALDANGFTIETGSVPVVGGRFTIPGVTLGFGAHIIAVSAIDAAGNRRDHEMVVHVDPNPEVTLVGAVDGQAFLTSQVTLGLDFAAATTLVSVNDVADGRTLGPGLVPGALTVPLELGPNPVRLLLEAGGGVYSLDFTLFRVDSLDPLRITTPADGAFLNSASQLVRGTVARGTPFVTVNGVPAVIAADQVSFSATVSIREGANAIQAIAHPFGQTDQIEVHGDFVPPRLLALLPDDGGVTSEAALEFSGFADEPVRIELLGPGGSASGTTRAPTGPFAALHGFVLGAIDLIDGPNSIEVLAIDRAGNETARSIEVRRLPLALQLVAPDADSTVPGLRTDLVLEASETVTLDAVHVTGRWLSMFAGQTLAPGSTTLPGVLLVPGVNEVRIVFHREGSGGEVLSFSLVSAAQDVATLVGTVTDARTGDALGGALVSLDVNGTSLVAVAAADGTYRLDVEPGMVTARATQPGFATETILTSSLASGETRTADASLDPLFGPPPSPDSVILVGSIRSRLTGALEGDVRIEVLGTEMVTRSDLDGSFVLSGVGVGTQTLHLVKPGFRDEFFTLELAQPPDLLPIFRSFQFPLAFGESGRLAISSDAAGFVRDDLTGVGLAGSTVTAGSFTAVTDANGAFSLTGLPFGSVEITASGPGHQGQTLDALVVANADDTVEFRLAALTQGSVVGSVTDAAGGAPIGGATVRVAGSTLLAAGTAGATAATSSRLCSVGYTTSRSSIPST